MTNEDKQKYCDEMRDLFGTPGWKWLEAQCEAVLQRSDNVDSLVNEAQLWFAKGEKAVAREILQLPDDILEIEKDLADQSEETTEDGPDAAYS